MEKRLEDDGNRADCRSRRILDRSLYRCFTPVNVENRQNQNLGNASFLEINRALNLEIELGEEFKHGLQKLKTP